MVLTPINKVVKNGSEKLEDNDKCQTAKCATSHGKNLIPLRTIDCNKVIRLPCKLTTDSFKRCLPKVPRLADRSLTIKYKLTGNVNVKKPIICAMYGEEEK